MRRHGWQLPYHPLQIVAVSVFLAFAFSFYVFFIPFVGSTVLKIAIFSVYSPTVFLVFVLYVWCVGVNPADDGLLTSGCGNRKSHSCRNHPEHSLVFDKSRSATCRDIENRKDETMHKSTDSHQEISQFPCMMFVLFQRCLCKSKPKSPIREDDMLYCSLCKVEISADSKHCRVCDKCVSGFDHHCRWLNNCIGKKNYKEFVALMVSAIAMLILQWSVGLWVVVHYFLRLSYFQNLILLKLGSSFSSVVYIIILASCTFLSMAATYPLCQLLSFHSILMRKGITTYDYIIAMREQDPKGVGDSVHSPATSPISSIGTITSGGSSIGGLHGRAWCTPPRLFVDNEEDAASESHLSMKEWNSSNQSRNSKKKPVKLNPWNLAALNKDEVLRLASVAKKNSSILGPVSSNPKLVLEGVNMSRQPYSNRSQGSSEGVVHHDDFAVNERGNLPGDSSNTSIMHPTTGIIRNLPFQVETMSMIALPKQQP